MDVIFWVLSHVISVAQFALHLASKKSAVCATRRRKMSCMPTVYINIIKLRVCLFAWMR
jgi:hypothetical protein